MIFFACDAKNIWPLYNVHPFCFHSCRWFIQKLHSVLQTNCQCLVDVRGSGHHRGCLKGTRFFKHSLGNIIFQVLLLCCKFFFVLWYYDKFDKHKNRQNEDVIFVVSFFCKQIQEQTTSYKVKVQLIELIPERWNNNKNHLDRDVWYVGSLSCLTSSEGSCPSSNTCELAFFKGFQCFLSGEMRTRSVIQKLTSKSG